MTKRCRNKVRNRGKLVLNAMSRLVNYFAYVQDSEIWTDWKFRTISQKQAENLVLAGEAEVITREKDGVVQVVGYRALTPTSWEEPSPATLTFATMRAVGKQAQGCRLTRRERDHVFKFKVWPLIGDDKAVAVRPRISEADRRFAESCLRSGRLQAA
jgi:hypothetical protein